MIRLMIEITANPKSRNAIKKKKYGNTRERTCWTHSQVILIRLTTVNIDSRDGKKKSYRKKGSYQTMCKVDGKVADDSI